MGISRISVERPISVLMLFIAVIIVGMISLSRLPIELMPNTSFGTITIHIAVRGGMPPTEVESMVSRIVEDAVSTVSHIKDISSTSKEGESTVTIEFEPGTDMDFAGLEVREKFARVKNKLPKEIEKPVIAKYQQSDVPIVILTLSSVRKTPEELRKIVDDQVKERFQRVEGVANVDIGGGRERKIIFDIDQAKLKQYGLAINQVINMIGVNNLNLLVGDVERTRDKYLIRAIGSFEEVDDVEQISISQSPQGSLIRVSDIGVVKDSYLDPKGFARLNLRPVVSLYLQKETTANTVKSVAEILDVIEETRAILPSDIEMKVISNQSEEIERAINTVKNALMMGALLAVVILYLFLRDIRATFIIASSIPLSVVATFIFMYFSGITINVMTLSGLALGIGMLVDSAIVVLENIFKYKEEGISDVRSAVIGSEEVVMSIVASTITTIVVFLPIIFVNKKIQLQYSGLAFTVTFSLISSMIVSLSLVPMLFSRLSHMMPRKKQSRSKKKAWLMNKFRRFYRYCIGIALRYRYRLLIVALLALTLTLIVFKKFDRDLNPGGDTKKFTTFVELPSGAKLERSDEVVRKVEKLFSEIPEVETYSSRVEGWSSKIYITLVPQHKRRKTTKQIIDELRPQVRHFKDAFIYFKEDSEAQQKEVSLDLYGYDYKVLKEIAVSVASRFGTVPEFQDVKIRMREGRPEMRVTVDREKARSLNLTVKQIADVVHAKMRGLRASTYHTDGKEVEIIARLREEDRDKFDKMRHMLIAVNNGDHVTLDQVADFDFDLGPSEIWRKNKSRMIQVSADRSISLTQAVKKIEAAVADIDFPADYYYRFGSDYEELKENDRQLKMAFLITIILIYLVLASLFESYYQPFIILAAVPMALIGVTIVLKFKGMSLTMGSMIGLIMLGGIVVNNAIILIDSVNALRLEKNMGALRAVIIIGQNRLRPIMMTTLTTVLGLLPMAMDKSESAELWAPLAITVIAGIASSTLLTLFVVPCLYVAFEEVGATLKNFFSDLYERFWGKDKSAPTPLEDLEKFLGI